MTFIDATTPQLKLVDQMFEAYTTRDMKNVAPFFSKDFAYRSLPKIADLPDQTKEGHVEAFQPLFAGLVKLDVRIHHRVTGFELTG